MIQPFLIAHRGGLERHPENSLDAFQAAIDCGVGGVELDVQLSPRGALVVRHDYLPEDADDAAWPHLAQVLERVAAQRPDMRIVIDLKAAPWSGVGQSAGKDLIDAIAPVVLAYPRRDQIVLGSFDWEALGYARSVLPGFATAFHTLAARWLAGLSESQTAVRDPRDYLAWQETWRQAQGPGFEARSHLDLFRAAGGRIWSCQHRDLTEDAIVRARALGLAVWTWTVNTEDDLRRVLALGVDTVTTDRPEEMMRLLQSQEFEAAHV